MRIRGKYLWAASYIGAGTIVLFVTALLWFLYEREARVFEVEKKRGSIQMEIDLVARSLENAIARNSNALDALATYVSLHQDVSRLEFEAYARRSFLKSPEFKLVALAPDLVVSSVFPVEGNQTVIGLDYNKVPEQLAAVQRAVDAGEVVIAGPVDLVQGGQALIARKSVYTTDHGAFGARLWGIVSLVLDIEKILYASGVSDVPFEIALRGKDGLGNSGDMIRGQAALFARDPVRATVNLPVGHWVLVGAPEGGWAVPPSTFFGARIGFALSGLLAVIVIWSVMRLVQLRMRADARLSAAMDCIDDGFAYYDRDDRLVACNATYKDIYAISAEVMVPGAKFEDIIRFGIANGQYSEALGREEEFFQDRMRAHKAGNVDLEQRLEDGRWLRVSESKTPDGGTVGFRVDITELKNAKEAAEQANQAKSEFLDVMSHELRTPLTVVLGGTPFLCKPELLPAATKLFNSLEAKGEDADDIKAEVEALLTSLKSLAGKVERSAKHLLTLINDVLDFSKIEAGRMDLNTKRVNLGLVVSDLVEEYSLKADAKSLYLDSEVGELFVEADELRLRQVLINIIGNALKFTDEGGVKISSDDRGPMVKVIVTDTGCGIPADRVDVVFNKFSQVDSGSARKVGGTGLGMAISKKIVEMHGGGISVESVVGEGSTFIFTLPRAKAEAIPDDVDEVPISA